MNEMQTEQTTILPVGERVILDGAYTQGWQRGTVVGHVVLHAEKAWGLREASLAYVIRLDQGFYAKDGETFVSAMVVNADAPELRAGEE